MAVNADIGEIDAILASEKDDRVNTLGIKGIGELGNVGMRGAVPSAVFDAAGVRVRHMPIGPEDLLGRGALSAREWA